MYGDVCVFIKISLSSKIDISSEIIVDWCSISVNRIILSMIDIELLVYLGGDRYY